MRLTVFRQYTLVLLAVFIILSLSACAQFFDKDNTPTPTPLVNFNPTIHIQPLWSVKPGPGAGSDYLKLKPALKESVVWTTHANGVVTATDQSSGKKRWKTYTQFPITTSAGLVGDLLIIGTRNGVLFALTQSDGKMLWKTQLSSEIFATPVGINNRIYVKTLDGGLYALNADQGHIIWHVQQTEPTLVLRGASTPQLTENDVIAGFANGNLINVSQATGSLRWEVPLATPKGSFAIQRMIDIDADPIILGNTIYAATYQGQIAALNLASGHLHWSHQMSSYTGMAVGQDKLFISDGRSDLWAYDKTTGEILWHQTQLRHRNITGPTLMGSYLVVGDGQGYLHWLNQGDGQLAGRIFVDKHGILASPIVNRGMVLVSTREGRLSAYTLS